MQHKPHKDDANPSRSAVSAGKRVFYLCLGFFMVALGIIGAVLPVMPTTIFIILAAACFARSSPKFEARLLTNPHFGPMVIKWRERGAIPPRAKLYACLGMIFGYGMFWWSVRPGPMLALLVALFMLGSAIYVLSRPGE
ncbi:YbaN family protein [Falsochrobactrum sp. TDYN1]|uniref:YbaN family protein n=1 Tax=Falsochrobactrum tianjinense TaxID=2706015 RepID=A0A949UT83_9HYPH|nr:YbaN family protein [Falsochrobactrum sp. TDYN1]MBV2142096.1 YbaN family protein [Falsochrobactrum sp. TDYN1]